MELREAVVRAEMLQARNTAQGAALSAGVGRMADRGTAFVRGLHREALSGDGNAIADARRAVVQRAVGRTVSPA